MAYLSIEISGLKELTANLDQKQLKKGVAIGIGQAVKGLHRELSFAVKQRYNAPRSVDSVLIGGKQSTTKFGLSIIESGLQYRFKAEDMSKFPYIYYMGNINPANRQGPVHEVEIVKGRRKIVYGKEHRGGFVPRKKGRRATTFGKFGAQMFERTSRKKLPVRTLYGPSVTHMIANVFEHDSNVQRYKDKLIDIIAAELPI